MTPAGRLTPAWLSASETRRLVAALDAEGGGLRFVGGCVRDSLVGRPVVDIDAATVHRPEEVLRRLEASGLRAVPTGLDHGTVTAIVDAKPFEVTTLREDVETFGRHARVAFTDDWEADAARRDFTINALSLSPGGELYDPFGGREDLAAGRVRFVGEAEARVAEDYLRLLRFFRFHAHFGRGRPDAEALKAARLHAEEIRRLAAERLRAELKKLLEAPDPRQAVEAMIETGVAEALLAEPLRPEIFAALVDLELALGSAPDWLRRLAGLLAPAKGMGRGGADAEALAGRLRFSRAESQRLSLLSAPMPMVAADMMPEELRALSYRHGAGLVTDRLLLGEARRVVAGAPSPNEAVGAALRLLATWAPPRLPVTGSDLRALGIAAGPALGSLLAEAEDWWVSLDFAPDREACLTYVKERLAGQRE